MPYYSIIVEGTGILIPTAEVDNSAPIIGFYSTRVVFSKDQDEAASKAVLAVANLWRTETYVKLNAGAPPKLIVDEIGKMPFLRGLFSRKRSGHVFYPADPEEDAPL